MSKYVKEMMMDQLKTDLEGSTSLLILDLKGLDAVSEHAFRRDLRAKKIHVRVLKNKLARRVFTDMGVSGLDKFLEGPSVAVWGGDGVAELAKAVSAQVKTLKKPAIKGGAVDGVIIGPGQIEEITKLPSREALIARVASLALAPVTRIISLAGSPASGLMGQLKTLSEGAPASETEGEGADDAIADAEPRPEAAAS